MVNVSTEENKLNFMRRIFFRIHVEKTNNQQQTKWNQPPFICSQLHHFIFSYFWYKILFHID